MQVSLAMRAYESDCARPYIWATAERLLARLFAPESAPTPQAEGTDRSMPADDAGGSVRPVPTFEDALARHYPELSLPDPEPPCDREAMFEWQWVIGRPGLLPGRACDDFRDPSCGSVLV